MKTNKNSEGVVNAVVNKSASDKLQVLTQDASTTKSAKKGGSKVDANIISEPRTKSAILADMRNLCGFDWGKYSQLLTEYATNHVGGIDAVEFEQARDEMRESCKVTDCKTASDILNIKGIPSLVSELCNLYGKTFEDCLRVFDFGGKIRIYSRDNNDEGNLNICENGLFFRDVPISTKDIINGLAGAGTFFDRVRIEGNKQARERAKTQKAVDVLKSAGLTKDALLSLLAELG